MSKVWKWLLSCQKPVVGLSSCTCTPLSQEEREARRTVDLPFFYNIIWCSSKCLQCNHTLMLPYKYIFSRMEPTTASPKQTFIRTVAPDLLPWYNMYKVGKFVSRMSGFSSIYSWCQQRMTKVLWLVCSLKFIFVNGIN